MCFTFPPRPAPSSPPLRWLGDAGLGWFWLVLAWVVPWGSLGALGVWAGPVAHCHDFANAVLRGLHWRILPQ